MNKEEQLKLIEERYPLYTHHKSNRRIRHDFFKDILTEIQAYLLGFYAADGSVDEKRKTFRIHLSNKDSEIVYLFKDIISPDARLFSIVPGKENPAIRGKIIINNGSIGVDITSVILVLDIVDLGIGYRKTYGWTLPNISKDLLRHFIRGYFDGDGTFSYSLLNEKSKSPRIKAYFSIFAKLELSANNILSFIPINLNINYLLRDDMYKITTSSKKVLLQMYDYMYDDCNFFLLRKYNKFNHYVNTETQLLITELLNCNALTLILPSVEYNTSKSLSLSLREEVR